MPTAFDPQVLCWDLIKRFGRGGWIRCFLCRKEVPVRERRRRTHTIVYAMEHAEKHLQASHKKLSCSCANVGAQIFKHKSDCPNYDPLADGYVDCTNEYLNGLLSILTKCYDKSRATNIGSTGTIENIETSDHGSGSNGGAAPEEGTDKRTIASSSLAPEKAIKTRLATREETDREFGVYNGDFLNEPKTSATSQATPVKRKSPARFLKLPPKVKKLTKVTVFQVVHMELKCPKCPFRSREKYLMLSHSELMHRK